MKSYSDCLGDCPRIKTSIQSYSAGIGIFTKCIDLSAVKMSTYAIVLISSRASFDKLFILIVKSNISPTLPVRVFFHCSCQVYGHHYSICCKLLIQT